MADKFKIAFPQLTYDDNLGLMQLCANLDAAGFEGRIFMEEKGWLESVIEYNPDVIGFSCTTGQHLMALSTIDRLRALSPRRIPIIMGGPHPTFAPEIVADPRIDLVCIGEGDEAIIDLANNWGDEDKISGIKNLAFERDGKIVKNELRPLVEDLNRLPFPDRSYYDRYPFLKSNPTKYMLTGRGCPYDCSYCFNHSLKQMYSGCGSYTRRRSVANSIEEILDIKNRYGLGRIGFSCDVFILDRKWFFEFAEEYKRRVALPYICNVRANLVDAEIARALGESGCVCASFGIESGNDALRNKILKKDLGREQILNCAAHLKENGIKILTHNMVGIPGETLNTAMETVRLNREVGPQYPWCSILQFYPGTELTEWARLQNKIPSDLPIRFYSFYEGTILEQENAEQLLNMQKFFFYLVRFPRLEKLIMKLIKLPSNSIFQYLFMAAYAYTLKGRSGLPYSRLLRLYLRTKSKLTGFKGAGEGIGASADQS